MLSFSDSQSFSVSGLSAYSNFSAYDSSVSQAGGTFKVRCCVTQALVIPQTCSVGWRWANVSGDWSCAGV